MPKTLTVIAPVYQEAEVIEAFYRALALELGKLSGWHSKILLVVDRGKDNTLGILKSLAARDEHLQVIYMSSRFGHQMSLLAGIDHADSDAIIMMDADLQHPPLVIPRLITEFEKGKEIVNTIRDETKDVSFFKKYSSKLFYWLINHFSSVPIAENAADFRLISRRVASILKNEIRERNLFLRGIVQWMGFEKSEVHFVAQKRTAGATKYSPLRLMNLALAAGIAFGRSPLRLSFSVGALLLGAGVLGIVIPLIWTTIFSPLVILGGVFVFVGGVQLIFLGIVGEYVGSISEEVKRRPHYIIDEKIHL